MNKEKILAALQNEKKIVTYMGWTVCNLLTDNNFLTTENEHGFCAEWGKIDLTKIKIYQEIEE